MLRYSNFDLMPSISGVFTRLTSKTEIKLLYSRLRVYWFLVEWDSELLSGTLSFFSCLLFQNQANFCVATTTTFFPLEVLTLSITSRGFFRFIRERIDHLDCNRETNNWSLRIFLYTSNGLKPWEYYLGKFLNTWKSPNVYLSVICRLWESHVTYVWLLSLSHIFSDFG